MTERELELRNETYRRFVELGRAPVPEEVGDAGEVRAAWRRLHDAHALVLDDDGAIRMANPFSAVPTPHRVEAAGRSWHANCAWDAFGICAALGVDGRIETTCPDCGERIVVEVSDRRPHDTSLVFHCLVPAARWWDDIGFT
ncbi:MAG: organomercurial lyase [Pseudomonadota bacterium]